MSSFGADLDGGVDIEFQVGIRADDGADVAAIQNRAFGGVGRGGGEVALLSR